MIAEHKPHIDKMNKTGPQLLELSPREGFSIQEKYVAADTLYSQIKEDVKKRAVALDEAISQSAQVTLCTSSATVSPTAECGKTFPGSADSIPAKIVSLH